MTPIEARRYLQFKGYIIQEGYLLYVENDDPDDYRITFIAEAIDSLDDLIDYMERAGWPQTEWWDCPTCGDGLVYEIGAVCGFCVAEQRQAEGAGV